MHFHTIEELDTMDARARKYQDSLKDIPNNDSDLITTNLISLIRQCKMYIQQNGSLTESIVNLSKQCDVYKATISKYYQLDQNLDAIYGDMYEQECGLSG